MNFLTEQADRLAVLEVTYRLYFTFSDIDSIGKTDFKGAACEKIFFPCFDSYYRVYNCRLSQSFFEDVCGNV